MITTIALLITIACLPYNSVRLFVVPRNTIMALSLPVCFALWDGTLHIGTTMLFYSGALIIFWIASTAFATRPDISTPATYRHFAAMFFGLVAVPSVGTLPVFIALVAGACFNTIVSLIQRQGIYVDDTAKSVAGLTGNTNILGPFLLPCFFIALHIAPGVSYLPAAIILFGLIASRCRGSMLGLMFGLLFVHYAAPLAILIIAYFTGCLSQTDRKGRGSISRTIKYRTFIWKNVLRNINWKIALVGCGPDNSKLIFPALKLQIDGTPSRFRRAHNDFLQWVLDSGFNAAMIQVAIMLFSAWSAFDSGMPLLAAAIVALFVNGLVFHTQFFTVVNVVYWVIVGHVTAGGVTALSIPTGATFFITVILAIGFVATWGRIFLADIILRRVQELEKEKRQRFISLAKKINPTDSFIHTVDCGIAINLPDRVGTFYKTVEAIIKNDGELNYASSLLLHGIAAANIGHFGLAKIAFRECIAFDPTNENAKNLLDGIKNMKAPE